MSKNRKTKRSGRSRAARSRAPRAADGRTREVVGVLALGSSIFVVLAMISLQAGGRLMGPFGRSVAGVSYGFAGLTAYLLAAGLTAVSVRLLMDRETAVRMREVAGVGLGLISLATLIHLAASGYRVGGHGPGGVIGEHFAEVLRAVISTAGTALLAVVGLVCAAVIATPLRMRQVLGGISIAGRWVAQVATRAWQATAAFCGEVVRAILPERDHDEYGYDDYDDEYDAYELGSEDPAFVDPPIIESASAPVAVPEAVDEGGEKTEKMDEEEIQKKIAELEAAAAEKGKGKGKGKSKKKKKSKAGNKKPEAVIVEDEAAAESVAEDDIVEEAEDEAQPMIVESRFKHADAEAMKAKEAEADAERLEFIPLGDGTYQLPPVNLLDYDAEAASLVDKTAMLELSARLTRTLEHYGVKGEVVAIRPGPVVTMYEFAPAPGTRLNKITNLTDDLAMALEALRVRIVAPIPGKAAVGIEVPNKQRETVFFKEIVADGLFRNKKLRLPLALGKDIEGAPHVVDLSKMPHLLVAGTTGSGKSVSVNSMIASMLYHSTPDEVRLIMVDPKMLELSIYEGVPHLLLPVVTDPKKANLALRWAVEEMEHRYELLAGMGVRDIVSYNKKVDKVRAQHEADSLRRAAEEAERRATDGELEETDVGQMELVSEAEEPPRRLPYIVIVIDEFADLMMCAPKEVETSVARIAQKARAAGIHLILATQRPSVDVITGLIKANFPSRIAFHVTSKVDSRTILDQMGAEALLGAGDMLFTDRGSAPRRLHGCYIDEEEIGRVVDFLKDQGRPVYNLDILKPRDDDGSGGDGTSSGGEEVDEMYDRAVAIVAETGTCSISMIQRRLRVGYNRAARMVEMMEREGVVGPPDHTNRREVLVSAA